MSGFLRHIRACNPLIDEPFVAWRVEGLTVGWLRPSAVDLLRDFPAVFDVSEQGVMLQSSLQTFDQRSVAIATVADDLAAANLIPGLLQEPYPVTAAGREQACCVVDRAAAGFFGVRSFGQHLNGYVRRDDTIWLWIGRRARDRLIFPGALDNMVAGGLPYGISMHDNLVKECWEEAAVPADLAGRARPVGVITYNRVTDRGFRPDVLYCYDLELPPEFEPKNTDGEVEEFSLLPLQQVADIVRESDEFKLNCNLVIIDFMVRHGVLSPEHPDYLAISLGLKPDSGMPISQ